MLRTWRLHEGCWAEHLSCAILCWPALSQLNAATPLRLPLSSLHWTPVLEVHSQVRGSWGTLHASANPYRMPISHSAGCLFFPPGWCLQVRMAFEAKAVGLLVVNNISGSVTAKCVRYGALNAHLVGLIACSLA